MPGRNTSTGYAILLGLLMVALGAAIGSAVGGPFGDSDGRVAELRVCGMSDGQLGWYDERVRWPLEVEGTISYDRCEMLKNKATREEWRELEEHERAHADGWDHGEGTPGENPAYYPTQRIEGR